MNTQLEIEQIKMVTAKLLGRGTASTGAVEEITLGTGLSFSGTTLNASAAITGADTRVLFFDGTDTPAGDAGLTYNKTTDTLSTVDLSLSNDLLLASGSIINFNAGDLTLTHSSNLLTLAGGNLDLGTNSLFVTGDLGSSGSRVANGYFVNALISSSGTLTFATLGTKNITISQATISFNDSTGPAAIRLVGATIPSEDSNKTITLPNETGTVLTTVSLASSLTSLGTIASLVATTADINGGTVDGAVIGGASAAAGTFTTLGGTTITASVGFALGDGDYVGIASNERFVFNTAGNIALTGADLLLTENTSIQLDTALSADGTYTGITEVVTAGETVAFGEIVYLKAADSQWYLADADAEATAGPVRVGIAVTTGADNGSMTIMTYGKIRADAKFPALTVGAPVYISTTPGAVQTAQPSGTDDVIRILGHANTGDEFMFAPDGTYWTHT